MKRENSSARVSEMSMKRNNKNKKDKIKGVSSGYLQCYEPFGVYTSTMIWVGVIASVVLLLDIF